MRRLLCSDAVANHATSDNLRKGDIDGSTKNALAAMLQTSPCMLTELDLSGLKGLEGVDLTRGLLVPLDKQVPAQEAAPAPTSEHGSEELLKKAPRLPTVATPLACRHLRTIKLAKLGLVGSLPGSIVQCRWLETLEVQDNQLSGALPAGLWECLRLTTLALHGNNFSGEVNPLYVTKLKLLEVLTLGGEAGGNTAMWITEGGITEIEVRSMLVTMLMLLAASFGCRCQLPPYEPSHGLPLKTSHRLPLSTQ